MVVIDSCKTVFELARDGIGFLLKAALFGALAAMVIAVLLIMLIAVAVAFIGLLDTVINFVIGLTS